MTTEKCKKASKKFTKKDWQALAIANEEVQKRQHYGIREELTDTKGIQVSWSNANKEWCPNRYEGDIPKGKIITLDANECFFPMSFSQFMRIQPCIGALPLYQFSTEAKMRGEVDSTEVSLGWALKQLERINRQKGV